MRELSIIILQHNTPGDVEKNLKAIRDAWLPEGTEVIVVNNGGNGANNKIAKDACKGLDVKFFDTPNDGFPKGNNFGLSKTEAKYYAFVNPDIVVNEDTFKVLLEYMKANKEVGIVSPRLVYPNGTVQDNYRTFPRFVDLIIKRTGWLRKMFPERMRTYLMWDMDTNRNQALDWVTGAFVIVSEKCMKAIEKHDDYYFLFMSDVVLCRDAWEKGFEVHYVGETWALHDDDRVSAGGFKDIFKKVVLRIHIKDSIKYFWKYLWKRLPKDAPSLNRLDRKERLLRARKRKGMSFLTGKGRRLQKDNPVVQVYDGHVDAAKSYDQPIVFFDTGVVGVLRDQKGRYGLMKIWRHTPLSFNKKNTFPVFPDVGDLGIWSYEFPRGGVEKFDAKPLDGLKRELYEEIGLKEEGITEVRDLGRTVANTAIDVYSHYVFEITVKDGFKFKCHDEMEAIEKVVFVEKEELARMIRDEELVCGLTQAALAQSFL